MMSKIAFDVALLPPKKVMDICIKISRADPADERPLNLRGPMPHVSLFMGVMDKSELKSVVSKINKTVSGFKPIITSLSGTSYEMQKNRRYSFKIEKTKLLRRLHLALVKELKIYGGKKTKVAMFYRSKNEKMSPKSKIIKWVEDYASKHTGKNFFPHISLLASAVNFKKFSHKFIANRLAICHLGDHGTCRKILWETKLK